MSKVEVGQLVTVVSKETSRVVGEFENSWSSSMNIFVGDGFYRKVEKVGRHGVYLEGTGYWFPPNTLKVEVVEPEPVVLDPRIVQEIRYKIGSVAFSTLEAATLHLKEKDTVAALGLSANPFLTAKELAHIVDNIDDIREKLKALQ